MDEQQEDILARIAALTGERQRDITILYSELKLRLPSYLKTVTIQQLRDAGGIADPDITIPRSTEDRIRMNQLINEKFNEVRENYRHQVIEHYRNIRRQLPDGALNKKLSQLDDDEWRLLGIDIAKFRRNHLK